MLRVIRVIVSTLSMYIVTHLFVFAVLPFAVLISYVDGDRIPALKQWFVRSLLAIVGKRLKVSGYDNVRPDRGYVIISNYPSFYAGFALIGIFPTACVVAHAFLSRIPVLAQALRRTGTIFVQPGKGGQGRKAIDLGLSAGDHPRSVIILPEGALDHAQQRTPQSILPQHPVGEGKERGTEGGIQQRAGQPDRVHGSPCSRWPPLYHKEAVQAIQAGDCHAKTTARNDREWCPGSQ